MSDERQRPDGGRRAGVRSSDAPVAPGELPADGVAFGRYHLLKRLSYGGMGEIFLAKHDGIGGFSKLLVIKRLLQHYRGDRDVVAMFFDEAKLQALMNDRHIVQIWDMGKVDDQYFIAMEYVEGTSWRRLGERLREQGERLHPAHAVDLVVQACRGLGYAHHLSGPDGQALSLVHRDVNPQNILVSYAGEVKLIDFGIAKSELSGHHTETGTIKGKFAYMSPEQARAEPLDRRSDIFSMGICLYELLTGRNPFHRKNVVLSLEAICDRAPPALEAQRPDAAALAPVVERCLAKNPDERFADCAELEEALVSLYLDGLCGEPREPLGELLARLFEDDIARQTAFLRRHGFASLSAQRLGASDPGTPSPLSRPGESTRRTSLRRSRSGSEPESSRLSVESGSPAAETQPTATLALASLPSRSGERRAESRGADPVIVEEQAAAARDEATAVARAPRPAPVEAHAPSRKAPWAAVAVVVGLVLLVSLAALVALLVPSESEVLAAVTEPPEAAVAVAVPPPVVEEPTAEEPAALEPAAEEPAEEPPALEPAALEPTAEEPAAEEPAAEEPAAEEPSVVERRPPRRRPSREKRPGPRPPVVDEEPAPRPEKAAVPAGVLTVNAGGPFTIKGKGVRARNGAKLPLVVDGVRAFTITGGPVEVRLRVSAGASGAEVRVDSEPWTIVRANNIGRGRTPQTLRVERGGSVQLLLKHPDAGEMKVTLGLSP